MKRAALLLIGALAASAQNWPKLDYVLDGGFPRLPSGWTLEETPGVAVNMKHEVYVFHRGPHPIMQFDIAGNLQRSFGDGVYVRPHALKFDREGNLWAVDDLAHIVVKLDYNGRVRMVLGRKNTKGDTKDLFNRPTDIAFASNGDFYITDGYGNSRVMKFNKDGRFLTMWGKKGKGPGEFDTPHAVAVDNQGRVYVGDRENYRIQVFDKDGKFLYEWKHVGSPWGIAIIYDQTIFMCDGHNNRVLKLNTKGEVLGVLGEPGKLPGQFDFAHHVAAEDTGELFVAEIKNWRVQKFVPRWRIPK